MITTTGGTGSLSAGLDAPPTLASVCGQLGYPPRKLSMARHRIRIERQHDGSWFAVAQKFSWLWGWTLVDDTSAIYTDKEAAIAESERLLAAQKTNVEYKEL